MHDDAAPSPVLFFETLTAYQKTAALKAALELDLFTAIGAVPATSAEIAARCKASERGIRILCDYLTILTFLEKSAERYSLTTDSATFLNRGSPTFAGGTAGFLLAPSLRTNFDHLSAAVRKGGTADAEHGTIAPEHPVWIEFARGMAPMMFPQAEALADLLSLAPGGTTKVLDISASHGAYGMAVARRNADIHLVALDWEPVLKLTRENAEKAGLAERFSTIDGNAFDVELGRDYDVILIPNFLHHFDAATCVDFLRKVKTALRDGGRVAIVEFVPNPDRISPPEAASFSLVMLATTPAGDAYTFAEFQEMLSQAGFGETERHPLPPGVATAIIARR
ncbi:MAG: methyltransferase [Chthoniobacterales bacterium]